MWPGRRPRSGRACAPRRSADPCEPRPRQGARRLAAAAAEPAGIHFMLRLSCLTFRGREPWMSDPRGAGKLLVSLARVQGSNETALRETGAGGRAERSRTEMRPSSRPCSFLFLARLQFCL